MTPAVPLLLFAGRALPLVGRKSFSILARINHRWAIIFINVASGWGGGAMGNIGNTIYSFGCVVAATVFGIGVADYWFGHHQLTAFLSWAGLAAIPWLFGLASLYVLPRR